MRDILIDLLSKKAGRDVKTAFGSNWLRQDIVKVTGEDIGLNTVKRLTGVLSSGSDSSQFHARTDTMDIVARYLGFINYRDLQHYIASGSSQFKKADGLVVMDEQPVGTTVVIRWSPDREIILRRIDSGEYLVESSANSKLRVGDCLKIAQTMAGYPLIVKEVVREGHALGPYTAAPELGVTFVAVNAPSTD